MGSSIERATNLALLEHFVRRTYLIRGLPVRALQHAFQLLGQRIAPIHAELHGNLLGFREKRIRHIAERNSSTLRGCARRIKLARAILRIGETHTLIE